MLVSSVEGYERGIGREQGSCENDDDDQGVDVG